MANNNNNIKSFRATFLSESGIVLNIFNTIIGVGIVTLPYAMLLGGFLFVLLYSSACLALIFYTSYLMIISSQKREGIKTYGELCKAAYGTSLQCVLCFITFWLMAGFATVYLITLRKEFEDVIGDITGETFRYGKWVLVGVALVMFLFCLPRDISKLSYLSFVSLVCVCIFTVIAAARSSFYHGAMKRMSREKIEFLEKNLKIDRSLWLCSSGKSTFQLYNWPSLEVTNFEKLREHLWGKGLCVLEKLDWKSIEQAVIEFEVSPEIVGLELLGSNPGWLEIISYEHSRYLFNEYSLNSFGATERGFTLFSVVNQRFFVTIGTIASAFVFQSAAIENFQSLKSKSTRVYLILMTIAFVIVFLFSMLIALVGYFGQEYQISALIFTKMKLRYFVPNSVDKAIVVARIALIISVCLTFPMQFFYGRLNLMILVVTAKNKFTGQQEDPQEPSRFVFYLTTCIMFVCILIFGTFVERVEVVFALVGAAFAGPMIYLLPIVCWYSLFGGFKEVSSEAFKTNRITNIFTKIVFPVFVFAFGIFATVSSTLVTVLQLAKVID